MAEANEGTVTNGQGATTRGGKPESLAAVPLASTGTDGAPGPPGGSGAESRLGGWQSAGLGSKTDSFWLEHVRLGVWVSAVVIAVIAVYTATTTDQPNRWVFWLVLGMAGVLTAVVALLPWRRLVAAGTALWVMVAWSLSLVPLIVLLAVLDGGADSPLVLLLVLPMVFAAMAYPPRAAVGVGVAMVAGQLTVGLSTVGTQPGDVIVETTILVMVAVLGIRIARNHGRVLLRVSDLADRLDRLARVDELTGCLNRRGFGERLDEEIARAIRAGRPLALLHADLDHFKGVNDQFGHPAGDRLLAAVGDTLNNLARRSDVVARIGGEEFAVLLPDTTLADGREAAERLRQATGEFENPAAITVSVGVSALPETANTKSALITSADRALYAAKAQGRDQVVSAAELEAVADQQTAG